MTSEKRIDKPLIVGSLVLVLAVVVLLYSEPQASQRIAGEIFEWMTRRFGALTLLFTFFGVLLLVGVSMSRFGAIRLGDSEPEYGNFKWVAMMISCGLGSAIVYWAFIEWAYYIKTPGLGIAPGSQRAFEMALPYNMFHWGFSAWTLYTLVALPVCYHFYVRKNEGLSLSAVLCKMVGARKDGVISRIVDVMFIFICFGGLSITLGLSVPLVNYVLSAVIGVEPKFSTNVFLIVVISVFYSLSSYIGIKKGMAMISNMNTWFALLFCLAIVLFGPGMFIIANMTNSFGLMLQNFVQMSLFTDPIGKSGFPQSWTIFYWLYWITYAPFTGIFIAKVSRGRTLRSVIFNTLISGSSGCFIFFGVIGSFSIHRQTTGAIDMVKMLGDGMDNAAIIDVMRTLPMGSLFMIAFCIVTILFLATTLDGAAFTMASTATKGLREDEEPSPVHRLFWCILLALLPLTMIFIGADLETIKTCAIITGVPIVFIMITMVIGWVRWMLTDFGSGKELVFAADASPKTQPENSGSAL